VGLLLGAPEVRLLTLTGIGGVGKTRLALEAARASLTEGRFPHGASFVPLAPLRDPALAVPTIARSLGLREAEGRGAVEALRVTSSRNGFSWSWTTSNSC
jgi:predicted ATPase